jgi:GAF domain-containing protein
MSRTRFSIRFAWPRCAGTNLLDSPTEAAYDRLTRLAVRLLHVPVALVSLVDADRQFFKSCVGLPAPWADARETPLSHSFCQHVVLSGQPLLIEDSRTTHGSWGTWAITDLGVIAYAGIPLMTADGQSLGSFCASTMSRVSGQPRR